MKIATTTLTMIVSALLAVGCSNQAAQTPVESALDHAETSEPQVSGDDLYDDRADMGVEGGASLDELIDNEEASAEGESTLGSITLGEGAVAGGIIGASWTEEENNRVYLAAMEAAEFGDARVVPLAHFRRETRNVIVAWPMASAEGELLGAAVYGICVEAMDDGSFESCGTPFRVSNAGTSQAALARALGGGDYEVVSGQSALPLDDLGTQFTDRGNSFVSAAASGDDETLFRVAQELMHMLPLVDAALADTLPRVLVAAASNNKRFTYEQTERGDLFASIRFRVEGDWRDIFAMNLTAQQVEGSENQWRVVDVW